MIGNPQPPRAVRSVAPAQRSDAAKRKDQTCRTEDDLPVQGFQDVLKDLATVCRNRIRIPNLEVAFDKITTPTPYQRKSSTFSM